jgi:hypothetical protein
MLYQVVLCSQAVSSTLPGPPSLQPSQLQAPLFHAQFSVQTSQSLHNSPREEDSKIQSRITACTAGGLRQLHCVLCCCRCCFADWWCWQQQAYCQQQKALEEKTGATAAATLVQVGGAAGRLLQVVTVCSALDATWVSTVTRSATSKQAEVRPY